jgi:hypothetical protein
VSMVAIQDFIQSLWSSTRLADRQRKVFIRRTMAACCAGLSVFCSLQALTSHHTYVPVILASKDIPRGTRIEYKMLKEVQLLQSSVSLKVLNHSQQAVGMIAAIDFETNQPITQQAINQMPTPPHDSTSLRINLASEPSNLIVGQSVSLMASAGCTNNEPHGTKPIEQAEGCVLSSSALVIELPSEDKNSQKGINGLIDNNNRTLTTFALPAKDAVTILSLPPETAIIAIHTNK